MTRARWKRLNGALRRVMKLFSPPPKMTVSEWADRNRRLSPEASAAPGQWRTDRAPYQREMMDAVCDPGNKDVTFMTSSQVGKTEIINNILGYHIDVDPCPILAIQPTLEMAKAWSEDRLSTMLRDTPSLKAKVADVKSRSGENQKLHKRFSGGHLAIAGANSPASLASRPVRIVLFDEVDRFPYSAGKEGDPVSLGEKRTVTFFNRKHVKVSTPTIDGYSRIQASYEQSDQREYWLPCPHCGGYHLLDFFNGVVWEKEEVEGKTVHHPETAAHYCPHCGGMETDADLPGMLLRGEWRKRRPQVRGHAGFWINELYSPWRTFADTVRDFLASKDNRETYQVWVNTALAQTWKEGQTVSDVDQLLERRENYTAALVPFGGVVLVAGVDVQDDRLEVEVVAWGAGYESWKMEYKVFPGNTQREDDGSWRLLDEYLQKTFEHESGLKLRIVATGVDTGGHATKAAYAFCKSRLGRRVFALKGDGGQGKPLASRPSKNNAGAVNLYRVGVDTAKDALAGYLATPEPGPGYMHFPAGYDRGYFEQLLAERRVPKKVRGVITRTWEIKKPGLRNEAWDISVYQKAALEILNIDLDLTVQQFMARAQVASTGAATGMGNTGRSGRRMRSHGVAV